MKGSIGFVLACAASLSAVFGFAFEPPKPTSPADSLTIPFTWTKQNNILVDARINGTDAVKLMLHTAAKELMLTEAGAKKAKSVRFTGSEKVRSWGGESDSRFSSGNRVDVGALGRNDVVISEDLNSGWGSDGKFGLDFFGKRVVELDFDRSLLRIHENLPEKAGFDRLPIRNENGQPFVDGACIVDGKTYAHRFLIHSGYSGGILLDDAFAKAAGVDGKIRITEESALKDSFGNTIKVRKGVLPAFVLGRTKLVDVPIGFFSGALGRQKISVLGGDVLKRFNILFDVGGSAVHVSPRKS